MERTITALALMGVVALVSLNTYELGREHQAREQLESLNCATKYVYRRGVDTHSPEELRRIARFRERAT